MSSRLKPLVAMLILAAAAAGRVEAQESVTWMEVIFPPGYFQDGPYEGQGYEDVITDILREHLPGYRHERMLGNLARMYHEFKQGKEVCNVALFKTPEREAFMLFSIPSTFTLPNRLITTRDKFDRFRRADTVRLADVLAKDLRLGISRGRSYGRQIDAVLAPRLEEGTVFVHSGKDVFESLLRMLLRDRLDCMLGLPEEVGYVAEKMGVKDEIVTIALAENEGTYDTWLGYVACSKTDWGRRIIERIDRVLRKQRPTERYRGAYERWLDPKSIENYRRLYDEVFLSITE